MLARGSPGSPALSHDKALPFVAYGVTHAGLKREDNQDAFYISPSQDLLIVSDGVGSSAAGALASSIIVNALPALIQREPLVKASSVGRVQAASLEDRLTDLVKQVNELVLEKGLQHAELTGMGATMVMAMRVEGNMLAFAHVGDSRAYLLRRGCLERLTEDHTIGTMLLQSGQISRRQFKTHPARRTLTRFIGAEPCPVPDVFLLPLRPSDRILLCSDGLTDMVPDRAIGQILLDESNSEDTVQMLLKHALDAGGVDNITIAVLDAMDPDRVPRPALHRRVRVRRQVGYSLIQRSAEHDTGASCD
jgi:PPM family protein phosphatase